MKRYGCLAILGLLATPALAGPPYDTDDPVPTDWHHWELYTFIAGTRAGGALDGSLGLDINYGAARDLQLTATVPADFVRGPGARIGAGDLELGAKYRFYHDDAAGFSIAAFPRAILPTEGKRYGSSKTGALLPVWAQQDWGQWSLFAGGGYAINPGAGNRNYWQAGGALTRQVSERLQLGVETTWHGRDAGDGRPTATLGVGAIYRLKGPFSLLASAGPSFAGGRGGDHYHA